MRKKHKNIQLILVSIGLSLILLTYFYYPNINKNLGNLEHQTKQEDLEDIKEKPDKGQFSTFENVVYEGLYDLDKPFSVQSRKAYMLEENPDIVYMTDMHVILYLNDGRVINIVSNRGRYNKTTHDCFFEEDVKVTDKETVIFSENLDLLASESFAKAYNEVKLNHPSGLLQADQVDYDFETKYFKVSMFGEELVKMKVTQ